MRKQIFLLAVAGIISLPVASDAQQFNGPLTPAGAIFREGEVAVGSFTPVVDAKLYAGNAEDPSSPGLSQTTFRIQREILAGMIDPGHASGNLIEAITSSWPTSFKGFVLTRGFSMGLGTSTPNARLNVHNGNISLTNGNDVVPRNISAYTNSGSLNLFSNTTVNDGPAIELKGRTHPTTPGEIRFSNYDQGYFVFGKYRPGVPVYERQIVIGDDGNINMLRYDDGTPRIIDGNSQTQSLQLYSNAAYNNGAGVELYGPAHSSRKGQARFVSRESGDLGAVGFDFSTYDGANFNSKMRILKNGRVVIGDVPTPDGYLLFVKEGILTERLKVTLHNYSDWSDYVFADNYELKPLNEVEEYIDKNHHLPDVPSAEYVVKHGIDVAKMDATLLQKIEELTLYVIQQNKRMEALEKELKAAKK